MRFLHLSDLHIGKRLNEFSLLEDQAYILGSSTGAGSISPRFMGGKRSR